MAENVHDGYETSAHVERSAFRTSTPTPPASNAAPSSVWQSEVVTAQNSAMGVVHTSTLDMRESAAGAIFGDYVKAENSSIALLIAPRVSGNVKAVITLPVAFAFGFGYFFARRLAATAFRKRR